MLLSQFGSIDLGTAEVLLTVLVILLLVGTRKLGDIVRVFGDNTAKPQENLQKSDEKTKKQPKKKKRSN